MDEGSNSLLQKLPDQLWGPPTTIEWVQLALSSEIKRPACEANHSPPSSIAVKNYRSHISDPPECFHGVCRENGFSVSTVLPCWEYMLKSILFLISYIYIYLHLQN
jgi:hypothetical protein